MAKKALSWPEKPFLIAHRGGNLGEYENSMDNFRQAYLLGYRFLETDVILTADGQVMSYHGAQNSYMQRKTGLKKRSQLQKLTYEEICNLLSDKLARPPLLEELLKEFPDCFFSVDAKTWEVTHELANVIKRCKAENRVSVTSFNLRRSNKVAKLLGEEYELKSLGLFRVGAFFFMAFPRLLISLIAKSDIKFLHVPYGCVTTALIRAAKNKSISILAWSVNDEAEIRRLTEIKVDGIISDDIKLLQKITQISAT